MFSIACREKTHKYTNPADNHECRSVPITVLVESASNPRHHFVAEDAEICMTAAIRITDHDSQQRRISSLNCGGSGLIN